MLLSVIVLSFNSERTLHKCLSTAKETLSLFGEPSEIIVYENGSKDKSADVLKEHLCEDEEGCSVKGIFSDVNTGTTESRNAALAMSSGEYILVLDSDAYIEKPAIEIMMDRLRKNPTVGLVAPKLFYEDMRFQMSTDSFPTLLRKAQRFLNLDNIQSVVDHEKLTVSYVDYAISACWLLRRNAVESCNGFDENIFYSPEDVDYCMQVWQSGFSIVYEPNAEVVHDAQELSRGFKLTKFHFSHLAGLFYLFKKYRYFFGLSSLNKKLGRHSHGDIK